MSDPTPGQAKVEFSNRFRTNIKMELLGSLNTLLMKGADIYPYGSNEYNAIQDVVDKADQAYSKYYQAEQAYLERFGPKGMFDPNVNTPEKDRQLIEDLNISFKDMQKQILVTKPYLDKLNALSTPSTLVEPKASQEENEAAISTTPIATSPRSSTSSTSAENPVVNLAAPTVTSAPSSPIQASSTAPPPIAPSTASAPEATTPSHKKTSLWSTFVNFVKNLFTDSAKLTMARDAISSLPPTIQPINPTLEQPLGQDPLSFNNSFNRVSDILSKSSSENKSQSNPNENLELSERDILLQKIHEFNAKVDNIITNYEKPLQAHTSSIQAITSDIQERSIGSKSSGDDANIFLSDYIKDSKELIASSDPKMEKLKTEGEKLKAEVAVFTREEGKNDKEVSRELNKATQKFEQTAKNVVDLKNNLKENDINIDSRNDETSSSSFHR